MKDKILGYIKETLAEMKKVVWPDRRYVMVATIVILVIVIATSLFLMIIDYGLAAFFKALLR
jgi:preprotein translocase subunit SecE